MRGQFARYLVDNWGVPATEAEQAAKAAVNFREVAGAIAVTHQLLNLVEVEDVLSSINEERMFGEIAIEKGLLTREQVERLLEVQVLHELVEIGEALILRGHLTRRALVQAIADFHEGFEESSASLVGQRA